MLVCTITPPAHADGIIREITARRLSQMGQARRLDVLEALRVNIVRSTTCAIEHLKPHDWVLTRDEQDEHGELALRQVEETFIRTAYHLQIITLRSSTGMEQTLKTTAEHPVYVLGKGWITSGQIQAGDQLQEPTGDVTTILSSRTEKHLEGITVYNFRVSESHTYFVREAGSQAEPVWVHNDYRVRQAKLPFNPKSRLPAFGKLPREGGPWVTNHRYCGVGRWRRSCIHDTCQWPQEHCSP